ncbi:flagellar basal body rod protein FlgB [Devosia psychrophila]|jgi:flagellar basal-body rod protein FlgB|uniref:Flagellar basal body rod protein FlgB n=1 Tax=Devosia psychrophila TaxID=728005 RepID=A0A0F5PY17_9HYPH|nr:flagellar basal body rod protein FlgB [Devosia psychrophila]KKC33547.1 flagellar basal-body rod protein FlgB [Devosia psychrophila]SFC58448.1 flagellar basal-body rod protein FlgB [Devosia psychrophila]
MGLMNMPVFAALTDKMRWHQSRQGLLAENVANAETPGYRGRDLEQYDFARRASGFSSATVTTTATQPTHFSVSSGESSAFGAQQMANFEITPEGNGVSLEDEMMKVTTNSMDYQAATSLYQKSIKILKTAMGRQS